MKVRIATISFLLLLTSNWALAQSVRLIQKEKEKRVDVEVDGKLFTSYRWDERIKRSVLYPIMSADGSFITRGFPFETRDGETTDHPHQVGFSFSYGDVNGIDFWNTSTFRSARELEKMGSIVHQEILNKKNGNRDGELVTTSKWIMPTGKTILTETTKFTFHANGKNRWIDRETTLTASGEDAVFGDSKEGMIAIHVASELEQADQIGVDITSVNGVVSKRPKNTNLTGNYFDSEGRSGNKVWGTTAKWAAVSGKLIDGTVTLAIFDSPQNHNFPSYMMVRGYGLLALNPFGQKLYDAGKGERKFTLPAGKSMTFKHRLLILPTMADVAQIEKEYQSFIK
jgi:hypothetical protein